MDSAKLVLALLDEAYEKKTWHGPNLKQSIKGITAKQAAWRPGPGRHNIWEVTLHAAYWKYAVRRRMDGGTRGSFALKGSNFFTRPEKGNLNEAAWSTDKKFLRENTGHCTGWRPKYCAPQVPRNYCLNSTALRFTIFIMPDRYGCFAG